MKNSEGYDNIRFDDCRLPVNCNLRKKLTKRDEQLYNRGMWHKEFEIKLVHDGAAVMQIGSESVEVCAGDVVLCNPREPHCIVRIDDFVVYDVAVCDTDLCESLFDTDGTTPILSLMSGKCKFKHIVRDNERIYAATELLFSELERESSHKQAAVSGVLAYLFALLFDFAVNESTDKATEEFSAKLGRIRPSLEYIDKNFAENLSLQTISELSSLSPTYFSKFFKDVMGVGVSAYIKTVRIHNAEKLLRFTDAKIHAIAQACGFDDPCYFNRWFKENDGITPGEYRKRK